MPEEDGTRIRLLAGEDPICRKDLYALSYIEHAPVLPKGKCQSQWH